MTASTGLIATSGRPLEGQQWAETHPRRSEFSTLTGTFMHEQSQLA